MRASASRDILAIIKANLTKHPTIQFQIDEEEPPSRGYVLKSLSLDLRTGASGTFSSETDDPAPRRRTLEEEASLGSMQQIERLVFRV